MSVLDTERAMNRYFEVLGSDRFAEAVSDDVTWTIEDDGAVVSGDGDVRRHLDRLHDAMVDTRIRDLVVGDGMAFLEGDCATPGRTGGRVRFCVAYEIQQDRVSAMRLCGRVEDALRGRG